MAKPFLTLPSTKYKDSFIEAVEEFQKNGVEAYEKLSIIYLEKNFKKYVEMRVNQSRNNFKNNRGPQSTFWLVQGNVFLGRLQIRHNKSDNMIKKIGHIGYSIRPICQGRGFGKLILKLGLQKTREITNLKKVLITSKSNNYASQKIIKSNQGKLIKKKKLKDGLMRYFYLIELY